MLRLENYDEYLKKKHATSVSQVIEVEPKIDTALVSRDEKTMVKARKDFYNNAKEADDDKHTRCLRIGENIGE